MKLTQLSWGPVFLAADPYLSLSQSSSSYQPASLHRSYVRSWFDPSFSAILSDIRISTRCNLRPEKKERLLGLILAGASEKLLIEEPSIKRRIPHKQRSHFIPRQSWHGTIVYCDGRQGKRRRGAGAALGGHL